MPGQAVDGAFVVARVVVENGEVVSAVTVCVCVRVCVRVCVCVCVCMITELPLPNYIHVHV